MSPPGMGGFIYLRPRVQECACPCICGRNAPPQAQTLLGGDAYQYAYGGAMPRAPAPPADVTPALPAPPPADAQPFVKAKPKGKPKSKPKPVAVVPVVPEALETESDTESGTASEPEWESGTFNTPPASVEFETNYDKMFMDVPAGTVHVTVDFYGTYQNREGRKWTSALAWITVVCRPGGAEPEPWKIWKMQCESTKEWIKPFGVRAQWDTILDKVRRVRRARERRVRHLAKDFTEKTSHNMEACERCVSINALCAHFTVDAGRK
jgi:hypothetical protein